MKSVTVVAAVVARCVFPPPLGGTSRRYKRDEEYRSSLGLRRAGSQRCHGSGQYYFFSL